MYHDLCPSGRYAKGLSSRGYCYCYNTSMIRMVSEPLNESNDCNMIPWVKQMLNGHDLDQFILDLRHGRPINYTVDKIIKIWNGKVVLFTDENGKKFVLKQINPEGTTWDQYSLVLETVGSRIAEEIDLSIDRVRIIPPDVAFDLKPFPGFPATLHTFVNGGPEVGVGIWQRAESKRANVTLEEAGLTYSVIRNMSKSKDLQTITALDTFLGNPDRKDGNLFYYNGHYIGIDMGDILHWVLAQDAIRQLQNIQMQGMPLTSEEIEGLITYSDTLRRLAQYFPAEKVVEYLSEETTLSGLRDLGQTHYKAREENYFKRIARENINLIPAVITIIDAIAMGNPPHQHSNFSVPRSPIYHTVVKGECLSLIARKYGVSVMDIVRVNDIVNPALIYIGQKIRIP